MTQLPMLTGDGTGPATRGRIRVHFGDWREQEPDWPRPFVYVSDVPYGIAYESGWGAGRGHRDRPQSLPVSIIGDGDTAERDAIMAVGGWQAAAIFGPGDIITTPPWGAPMCMLIVDKGEGSGMGNLKFPWRPSYETVAVYGLGWAGKRSGSVLRPTPVSTRCRDDIQIGRKHPHQKPLDLLTELCEKAPPGLPIVDPFAGSGTTAVACALLGRECYTAEIDPQYFDVIRGRLAAVGVTL